MDKGYYTVEWDGSSGPIPFYGTHSGGETKAMSMEVYLSTRAGTKVDVPSGGLEFMPLELELMDLPAEGLFLESTMTELVTWNNSLKDGVYETRDVIVTRWANADFTTVVQTLTLSQAWCKDYKFPEGDRKSNEVRTMTATITHQGSVLA